MNAAALVFDSRESAVGKEPNYLNSPKRGARSGRELLTVMIAAMLASSLCSVFFAVMAGSTALLASFAVLCVSGSGGFWWQYRGRQRFPLKAEPKVRFVVGSSRR